MTIAWRGIVASSLDWEQAHASFDAAVKGLKPSLHGRRPRNYPHSAWELLEHIRLAQADLLAFMGKVWPPDAVSRNQATTALSNIVSLDESPLLEGLIYAGTDDGLLQITEDGGKNWRKIDQFPGVPQWTYVSDVHDAVARRGRTPMPGARHGAIRCTAARQHRQSPD